MVIHILQFEKSCNVLLLSNLFWFENFTEVPVTFRYFRDAHWVEPITASALSGLLQDCSPQR